MKIVIVGAGFTGVQLSRTLLRENHKVVLLDTDADRVREIGDQLDCAVIHSGGNSLEMLEKAGIASADALVTLTPSDEVNMIACSLADAVYPKVIKIARVRNFAYYTDTAIAASKYAEAFSGDRRPPFGIDWIINPDVEAAAAIGRAIAYGAVGDVIELGAGFGIVTLPVGEHSPLNGIQLRQLPSVEGWHYLVAYVETDSESLIPGGSTALKAGDRIGVLAKLAEVPAVIRLCDASSAPTVKMAVVGAGRIGSLVVIGQKPEERKAQLDRLLRFGWKVDGCQEIAVIDEDIQRCRAMTEQFRGIRVLCGDATEESLIREEGLDRYDLLVAASENPERNLVTAAYMKSRGVSKTIALISGASVAKLADRLDVDVTISMRETVVDGIMSHLRGSSVQAVHTVCGGIFELIECVAAEKCKAVGKTLRELKLSGNGILLLLSRPDDDGVIPNGDTVITAGDKLVLLKPAGDQDALQLFC